MIQWAYLEDIQNKVRETDSRNCVVTLRKVIPVYCVFIIQQIAFWTVYLKGAICNRVERIYTYNELITSMWAQPWENTATNLHKLILGRKAANMKEYKSD